MLTALLRCGFALADDRPLVVVNNQTLTVSDYMLFAMKDPTPSDPRKINEDMVKKMIEETIVLQQAREREMGITAGEVEKGVWAFLSRNRTDLRELKKNLRELGLSYEAYVKMFGSGMLASRFLEKELYPAVAVSDADVTDYYSTNSDLFRREPEMLRVKGIFLRTAGDSSAPDELKDRISKIYAGIKGGEAFEKIADRYNEGSMIGAGGAMGNFRKGELVPELDSELAGLNDGEVGRPVTTTDGLYILKLEKRTPATFTAPDQVKEKIKDRLLNRKRMERYDAWMRPLWEKSVIRINQLIGSAETAVPLRAELQAEKNKAETASAEVLKKLADSTEALDKLNNECRELGRSYSALSRQYERTASELQSIRERLARYDKPVIRIAGKGWSMLQIVEENIVAERVMTRLGLPQPLWMTGDMLEDFIAGEALYSRIDKEVVKEKNSSVELQSVNYAFDAREREFFVRYLLVTDMVEKMTAEPVIAEDEIKKYYEDNKKEYRLDSGPERVLNYFVIPFTGDDEGEMSALADNVYRDVVSGKSFENINKTLSTIPSASAIPGRIAFRQSSADDLPGELQDAVAEQAEGETRRVVGEGRFYIVQAQPSEPVYRPFWEVREEIRERLASARRVNPRLMLHEIRKEAEEIRE